VAFSHTFRVAKAIYKAKQLIFPQKLSLGFFTAGNLTACLIYMEKAVFLRRKLFLSVFIDSLEK
jgi:hypothetical protein